MFISIWLIYSPKKIKYLGIRSENKGLAYSLNQLLKIRPKYNNYKYISRMDADDISVLNRYEIQIRFLEKNPNIDLVGGYIQEFGYKNGLVKYPIKHDAMLKYFAKRNPLAHVTIIFRKSFFEKAGFCPVDTLLNEDTILWLNGFKYGCIFANIPQVLVKVRVGKNTFARRNNYRKVINDIKDRIKIINDLKLNRINYFFPFAYCLLMLAPKLFRNKIIPFLRYA